MMKEELYIHACKYAIGELTRKGSSTFVTSGYDGDKQVKWIDVVKWLNGLEPCEKAVSQKDVLDIVRFEEKWLSDVKSDNANTDIAFSSIKSKVEDLSSAASTIPDLVNLIDRVQAQTEIEANAYRYTLAKERDDAGEVEWNSDLIDVNDAVDIIRNLPPGTPTRKVGKWIVLKDEWGDIHEAVCSCCDANGHHKWRYCPNCGSFMIKGESEE